MSRRRLRCLWIYTVFYQWCLTFLPHGLLSGCKYIIFPFVLPLLGVATSITLPLLIGINMFFGGWALILMALSTPQQTDAAPAT